MVKIEVIIVPVWLPFERQMTSNSTKMIRAIFTSVAPKPPMATKSEKRWQGLK